MPSSGQRSIKKARKPRVSAWSTWLIQLCTLASNSANDTCPARQAVCSAPQVPGGLHYLARLHPPTVRPDHEAQPGDAGGAWLHMGRTVMNKQPQPLGQREWLVPQVAKFPREHRHTLARYTCDLAMHVHDALVGARHLDADGRAMALRDADIHLDQLRQYLQLAWRWRWQWPSHGQCEHVSCLTEELDRLISGWCRVMARSAARTGGKGRAAPGL